LQGTQINSAWAAEHVRWYTNLNDPIAPGHFISYAIERRHKSILKSYQKPTLNLDFLARLKNRSPKQLLISTLNLSALVKINPIVRQHVHAYQCQSGGANTWERIRSKELRIGFLMQMYKRERKYKSGWGDSEIVWDFLCKIVFCLLWVRFWK